jgi:hypothetical protein
MPTNFWLIVLVVGVSVLVGFMVLAALVVAWSRKALSTQQQAVSHVDESMELSRESVELCRRGIGLQEKTIGLVEVMIQNQREIIELLRAGSDRTSPESRIRA